MSTLSTDLRPGLSYRPPEEASGTSESRATVSVVGLAVALVRARRRLLILTAVALAVAVLHWMVAPRKYSAEVVFAPEVNLQNASAGLALGGLAARFGLSPAGMTPLAFYVELVRSDDFIQRLISTPLPLDVVSTRSVQRPMPLLSMLGDSTLDPATREQIVREQVLERTIASINADAYVVRLEYTDTNAVIAAAVANAYVQLINQFNVERQQSQAKASRQFLENVALPRASAELRMAEESLRGFLTRNVAFERSPVLRLEEARLQRQISVKQQSFLELTSQLERARVDEIQNTPVLTVISPATPPARHTSPRLTLNGIIAVILAGSAWLFWTVAALYRDRMRSAHPEEAALLADELRGVVPRALIRIRALSRSSR